MAQYSGLRIVSVVHGLQRVDTTEQTFTISNLQKKKKKVNKFLSF